MSRPHFHPNDRFIKQVHCDGAKEGDAVLQIVGEGPATSTPAEPK